MSGEVNCTGRVGPTPVISALAYPPPLVGRRRSRTDEFGRTRSHSLPYPAAAAADPSAYSAGGFLPTTFPFAVPFTALSSTSSPTQTGLGGVQGAPPPRTAYGLLSLARDAVLGLPDAARLVGRVCAQLERTGVATPFVFSALALDVRRAAVARLEHEFLAICADGAGAREEERWAEEARFAGVHELGMCLRWGLSRVVMMEGGRECAAPWAMDVAASHACIPASPMRMWSALRPWETSLGFVGPYAAASGWRTSPGMGSHRARDTRAVVF
ncbi:hypothetical protein DFH09DRAFT_1372258 [Mycena vulgaris]|nr:hypothetical protein DFH09DRAFT_1372258 [Mycena vulgaris]